MHLGKDNEKERIKARRQDEEYKIQERAKNTSSIASLREEELYRSQERVADKKRKAEQVKIASHPTTILQQSSKPPVTLTRPSYAQILAGLTETTAT